MKVRRRDGGREKEQPRLRKIWKEQRRRRKHEKGKNKSNEMLSVWKRMCWEMCFIYFNAPVLDCTIRRYVRKTESLKRRQWRAYQFHVAYIFRQIWIFMLSNSEHWLIMAPYSTTTSRFYATVSEQHTHTLVRFSPPKIFSTIAVGIYSWFYLLLYLGCHS